MPSLPRLSVPLPGRTSRAPVVYELEIFYAKWLAGVIGGQTGSKCNGFFFQTPTLTYNIPESYTNT
jgi:hypothetical protein